MEELPKIGDHIRHKNWPHNHYLIIEWVGDSEATLDGYYFFSGSFYMKTERIRSRILATTLKDITKVGETEYPHLYIVDHRPAKKHETVLWTNGIATMEYDSNSKFCVLVGEFP